MKKNILTLTLFPIAISLITGCAEDVKSTDIRTSGVYASIKIISDADNTANVEAQLKAGGSGSNTYLNLVSEDKLVAYMNDATTGQTLSQFKDNITGEITYKTTFSSTASGAQGTKYRVAFERSASDTSAPNSIATLPAGLSNLNTDKTTFARKTEAITLTWTAGDATKNLDLAITGDCINTSNLTPVDNGSYTINAATLKDNSDPAKNCSVTFTLSRKVSGTLDTAYGEGGIVTASKTISKTVGSSP